jgi:small subunit ribosomal protein S15
MLARLARYSAIPRCTALRFPSLQVGARALTSAAVVENPVERPQNDANSHTNSIPSGEASASDNKKSVKDATREKRATERKRKLDKQNAAVKAAAQHQQLGAALAGTKGGRALLQMKTAVRQDVGAIEAKERTAPRSMAGIETTSQNLLMDVISPVDGDYDQMARVASFPNASVKEITSQRKQNMILKYRRHEGDSGSTEIQLATLSERIRYIREHLRAHTKDIHNRRSLYNLLSRRRSLFIYLKRKNFPMYEKMLRECGVAESDLDWR